MRRPAFPLILSFSREGRRDAAATGTPAPSPLAGEGWGEGFSRFADR